MKKIVNYIKNNMWILYAGLFLFMVVRHAIVQTGTADDVWFLEKSKMGICQFAYERMQNWTSRNIIESVMLIILNLNKWVWIILDSAMFVLIAHSMKKIVCPSSNNEFFYLLIINIIIILFPFGIFSEAGWYATTLNYVWPLAFGLYTLSFIVRILNKENVIFLQKILVFLATVYATNQEQMSALILGFYGLFIIYCFIKHIKLPVFVYIIFVVSLIMLGYHGLCPGNANRKMIETASYYPEFGNFSLIDKIFLGLMTTISISLVAPIYIVYFFNIVLLYLIYKNKKNIKDIMLFGTFTFINLILSVSDKFRALPIMNQLFKPFSHYMYLITNINYSQIEMYLIILYFILFLAVSFYMIKKYLGIKIMFIAGVCILAAFCARVILGFSASIFISGTRTFVNSCFLIFIASLICLNYKKFKNMI